MSNLFFYEAQFSDNPNAAQICRIYTSESYATITAAGWANTFVKEGFVLSPKNIYLISYNNGSNVGFFDLTVSSGVYTFSVDTSDVILPVTSGDFAVFSGTAGAIADLGYLPTNAAKTRVVMANAAVLANHIAVYADVYGTVDDDAATAINAGNLQAGLSGTAGYLASFPSAASKGSLRLTAVANTGDTLTTISNAAMGQASVISIPDPGAATANFILSALAAAGTQHITSGSLQVDSGNLSAGASGAAGTLISYPATAANGSLIIAAANAGGAFNSTISNGTIGQSTVFTLPDPANAAARFLVGASATPFTSGNFPVASGVAGLMVDSGVAAANLQNKTNIIAQQSADIGGAGAGPIDIVVASATSASVAVATVLSSSNAVSILKVLPGAGKISVTFSGDPGASAVINYVVFVAAQ